MISLTHGILKRTNNKNKKAKLTDTEKRLAVARCVVCVRGQLVKWVKVVKRHSH